MHITTFSTVLCSVLILHFLNPAAGATTSITTGNKSNELDLKTILIGEAATTPPVPGLVPEPAATVTTSITTGADNDNESKLHNLSAPHQNIFSGQATKTTPAPAAPQSTHQSSGKPAQEVSSSSATLVLNAKTGKSGGKAKSPKSTKNSKKNPNTLPSPTGGNNPRSVSWNGSSAEMMYRCHLHKHPFVFVCFNVPTTFAIYHRPLGYILLIPLSILFTIGSLFLYAIVF